MTMSGRLIYYICIIFLIYINAYEIGVYSLLKQIFNSLMLHLPKMAFFRKKRMDSVITIFTAYQNQSFANLLTYITFNLPTYLNPVCNL